MADHVGIYEISGTLMRVVSTPAAPASRLPAVITGALSNSLRSSGSDSQVVKSTVIREIVVGAVEPRRLNTFIRGTEPIDAYVDRELYYSKANLLQHEVAKRVPSIADVWSHPPPVAPVASSGNRPESGSNSIAPFVSMSQIGVVGPSASEIAAAYIGVSGWSSWVSSTSGVPDSHLLAALSGNVLYFSSAAGLTSSWAAVTAVLTATPDYVLVSFGTDLTGTYLSGGGPAAWPPVTGSPVYILSWVPVSSSVSGVYVNGTAYDPRSFDIPITASGRIRDLRVWFEAIHDERVTGSTDHGLQGLVVSLRSPNVIFRAAHPLWNDPRVSEFPINADVGLTGTTASFGDKFTGVPGILQNSYLLWAGHGADDGVRSALGDSVVASSYHEFDTDIDIRTVFWDGSPVPNPRRLRSLYPSASDVAPGTPLAYTLFTSSVLYQNQYQSPTLGAIKRWGAALSSTSGSVMLPSGSLTCTNCPWFFDTRILPAGVFGSATATFPSASTVQPPPGWFSVQGDAISAAAGITGSSSSTIRGYPFIFRPSTNMAYAVGGYALSGTGTVAVPDVSRSVMLLDQSTPSLSMTDFITTTELPTAGFAMGGAFYQVPVSSSATGPDRMVVCGGMDALPTFIPMSRLVAVSTGSTTASSGDPSITAYSDDHGATWNVVTMPNDDPVIYSRYYNCVASNGVIFVALTYGYNLKSPAEDHQFQNSNIYATSPDGINWTQRSMPFAGLWADISWNGSTFVAVQTGGTWLATSPDGLTWTSRSLGGDFVVFDPHSVKWNGSTWCAVGLVTGSPYSFTSANGITWASHPMPAFGESVFGGFHENEFGRLAVSGSTFYALNVSEGGLGLVATSSNGITWGTSSLSQSMLYSDIAFSPSFSKFVALGGHRDLRRIIGFASYLAKYVVYFDISDRVLSAALPTAMTGWRSAVWNDSAHVMAAVNFGVSPTGTNIAASSPDGLTWTQRTMPTNAFWIDITAGTGMFVAVSSGSDIAATSPDGIAWTQRTLPTAGGWQRVAWNGSTFCAAGQIGSNPGIATSPDGVTWTSRSLGVAGGLSLGVLGTRGTAFVLAANTTSTLYTSPDGVTWTPRSLPIAKFWTGIADNGSMTVMVAAGTSSLSSPDGVTWTERTIPSDQNWSAVVWDGSEFVAFTSDAGFLATSPDGITWDAFEYSDRTGDSPTFATTIPILGLETSVLTSSNGSAWAKQTSSIASPQNWSLVWDGTTFVAVGGNSATLSSSDGITWSESTSSITPAGWSMLATGSVPVLTGTAGKMSVYVGSWASSSDDPTWATATQSLPVGLVAPNALVVSGNMFVLGGYMDSGRYDTEASWSHQAYAFPLDTSSGEPSASPTSQTLWTGTMPIWDPTVPVGSYMYSALHDVLVDQTGVAHDIIYHVATGQSLPRMTAVYASLVVTGVISSPVLLLSGASLNFGLAPQVGIDQNRLLFFGSPAGAYVAYHTSWNSATHLPSLDGPFQMGPPLYANQTFAGQSVATLSGVAIPMSVQNPVYAVYTIGRGPGFNEFFTYGQQIGPTDIQPVYPILDDVFVRDMTVDQRTTSSFKLGPTPGNIVGFRPGLRGSELSGTWNILVGCAADHSYSPSEGYSPNTQVGIWFRQARIEASVDVGRPAETFIPSSVRRYTRSTNSRREGRTLVSIQSGSAAWDVGLGYVETHQAGEYGRTVGITDNTSSVPDSFAVLTFITGALYAQLSGNDIFNPSWFLEGNGFGTPFIPDSSMSLGTGSAEQVDTSASAELYRQTIGIRTIVPGANDAAAFLNRQGYSKTMLKRWEETIAALTGTDEG